jgi:hypothetical protein
MDEYEKIVGQPIQHVHLNADTTWTGYEKRVSAVGMNVIKVDGWIGPNVVIEYHGDFFHGHERFDPEEMNKFLGVTYGELNYRTMVRMDKLVRAGNVVKYVWESDFKKWLKSAKSKTLESIVKTHTLTQD